MSVYFNCFKKTVGKTVIRLLVSCMIQQKRLLPIYSTQSLLYLEKKNNRPSSVLHKMLYSYISYLPQVSTTQPLDVQNTRSKDAGLPNGGVRSGLGRTSHQSRLSMTWLRCWRGMLLSARARVSCLLSNLTWFWMVSCRYYL